MQFDDYNVNVWDVGGQKSIRTFWKNYFERTEGLIWVVDCADRSRLGKYQIKIKIHKVVLTNVRNLGSCREEMHKLLQEERLQGSTLLVLANKQDLDGAATSDEIRDLLKLGNSLHEVLFIKHDLDNIKTHHWSIEPISAVNDQVEKLQKAFGWIVGDIASRVFTLD